MVNNVLSEPIRPHFAIASVDILFNLQEAHQLVCFLDFKTDELKKKN